MIEICLNINKQFKKKILNCFIILVLMPFLQGCPLAIVAALPLGGLIDSNIEAKIDESTVTEELKTILSLANIITFLSDEADNARSQLVFASDVIDRNSNIEVLIKRSKEGYTSAQRFKSAILECSSGDRPNVVISSAAALSDASTGRSIATAVIGRTITNYEQWIDVVDCRINKKLSYKLTLHMNEGFSSMDLTRRVQLVGQEIGKSILEISGKNLKTGSKES